MINIKRAFHGAHKGSIGLCTAMLDDCTEENAEAYDWSLCMGLQYCVQPVKKSYLESCKKDSQYLQVEYECVSVGDVLDICNTKKQIRYEGYISSPSYPSAYKARVDCKCHLVAVGGMLYLTFADLALEDTSKECKDWVLVQNQTKEEVFCSQQLPSAAKVEVQHFTDVYFSSNANDVKRIKVTNDKTKELKGFWLHMKGSQADTKITVTCSPTSHIEPKSVKKKIYVKTEDRKFKVPSQMRTPKKENLQENLKDKKGKTAKMNNTEPTILKSEPKKKKGSKIRATSKTLSGTTTVTALPANHGITFKVQLTNYLITTAVFIKFSSSCL
ncbi:uncharacterized protein LOC106180151 [Lingula anatina]|uniref:Uncharacterized protein LOC106180151 n=1 Tax=Lingula anatina TaxID=7574 RepID=A0A1S3KA51_LINAN|nr:uncharacterized protein LOC106180151 [Lingula anatina]|eukprot:XP_013419505.1 uncharacterized protein LOC106180151 [Lingula anatina]